VVLVDFGLVKTMADGSAPTRAIVRGMGTLEYASPEQYTGGTDARSDIYSLGATLYEALTGQRPASATEQMSGAKKLMPLHTINGQVSTAVEQIILTALSLNRDQRFQSASAMRAALHDASSTSSVARDVRSVGTKPTQVIARQALRWRTSVTPAWF